MSNGVPLLGALEAIVASIQITLTVTLALSQASCLCRNSRATEFKPIPLIVNGSHYFVHRVPVTHTVQFGGGASRSLFTQIDRSTGSLYRISETSLLIDYGDRGYSFILRVQSLLGLGESADFIIPVFYYCSDLMVDSDLYRALEPRHSPYISLFGGGGGFRNPLLARFIEEDLHGDAQWEPNTHYQGFKALFISKETGAVVQEQLKDRALRPIEKDLRFDSIDQGAIDLVDEGLLIDGKQVGFPDIDRLRTRGRRTENYATYSANSDLLVDGDQYYVHRLAATPDRDENAKLVRGGSTFLQTDKKTGEMGVLLCTEVRQGRGKRGISRLKIVTLQGQYEDDQRYVLVAFKCDTEIFIPDPLPNKESSTPEERMSAIYYERLIDCLSREKPLYDDYYPGADVPGRFEVIVLSKQTGAVCFRHEFSREKGPMLIYREDADAIQLRFDVKAKANSLGAIEPLDNGFTVMGKRFEFTNDDALVRAAEAP